jgi:hypothetical protein
VGHAVLAVGLGPRDLEVAHELRVRRIRDVVDGVGAAVRADARVAGRDDLGVLWVVARDLDDRDLVVRQERVGRVLAVVATGPDVVGRDV